MVFFQLFNFEYFYIYGLFCTICYWGECVMALLFLFPIIQLDARAHPDSPFVALGPLSTGGVRRWVRLSCSGLDRIHPRRQEQPRAKPGGGVGITWRTGKCIFHHVTLTHSHLFIYLRDTLLHVNKLPSLPYFKIFYRVLREIPAGEELSVWYSNALAQWYDIPTTATPTHDEKGKSHA